VVEVVKKANPHAKILISLGGWADSAGDKYSRYSYSILKYSGYNYSILIYERVEMFAMKLAIANRHSHGPFLERKQIKYVQLTTKIIVT
jgi:hypothetical protein